MGYAFINFSHPTFIIEFYYEYNKKPWRNRCNSNKICELRYAKFQGRDMLGEHFKGSQVNKHPDKTKRPIMLPTMEPDEEVINGIISKYSMKRKKKKNNPFS